MDRFVVRTRPAAAAEGEGEETKAHRLGRSLLRVVLPAECGATARVVRKLPAEKGESMRALVARLVALLAARRREEGCGEENEEEKTMMKSLLGKEEEEKEEKEEEEGDVGGRISSDVQRIAVFARQPLLIIRTASMDVHPAQYATDVLKVDDVVEYKAVGENREASIEVNVLPAPVEDDGGEAGGAATEEKAEEAPFVPLRTTASDEGRLFQEADKVYSEGLVKVVKNRQMESVHARLAKMQAASIKKRRMGAPSTLLSRHAAGKQSAPRPALVRAGAPEAVARGQLPASSVAAGALRKAGLHTVANHNRANHLSRAQRLSSLTGGKQ